MAFAAASAMEYRKGTLMDQPLEHATCRHVRGLALLAAGLLAIPAAAWAADAHTAVQAKPGEIVVLRNVAARQA
jgi:hypothetical protein